MRFFFLLFSKEKNFVRTASLDAMRTIFIFCSFIFLYFSFIKAVPCGKEENNHMDSYNS